MSFASLAFIPFFLIVSVGYYLLPQTARWAFLLLAGCYFYMAFVPGYILVLFALIFVDFWMALLIQQEQGARRKLYLTTSIVSNLGLLFVFKYFNFFNANIELLAQFLHWNYSAGTLHLLLPLGLSFHTFQSLSYVIEVYRGKYPAERHLGIYAVYVLFFPQLIAGPIERPQHLLPQLKKTILLNADNILTGLRLMAWGFFKKLVIADRLAGSVDYVYLNVGQLPGESAALAAIFFSFQLYCDFSGYSDIARGAARVLGIDVMQNFENPYFSSSIAEFWRRWHISLSSWFRDYFYYPLVYSASRATRGWLYACVIFTFLATGVWHGAGWTFVMLGLTHGAYITLGLATKSWRDRIAAFTRLSRLPRVQHVFRVAFTFVLVSISWVFFRAPDMHVATTFLTRLFTAWRIPFPALIDGYFLHPFPFLGISRADLLIAGGSIIVLVWVEHLMQTRQLARIFGRQHLAVRSTAYAGLVLAIVIFGVFTTKQFIYFQF